MKFNFSEIDFPIKVLSIAPKLYTIFGKAEALGTQ